MNIQEAQEEIIRTIRAYGTRRKDGSCAIPVVRQRPLLLIGPPGIGKTAIMEQAAHACGVGFVSYSMTHHTRQSALGLPTLATRSFGGRNYAVTEYTMSEIIASVYACIEETGVSDGLLFLDEINCVSETLAPAMLQFLQTKTFGSHRLPEGWVLAAAGNPPEYNKSVREFDIATLDRLKYITVEADYEAWRSYALAQNVHSSILTYLDIHPDCFYLLHQTRTEKAFATARGWEDLSFMLREYEALGFPAEAGLIRQYLQEDALAGDFAGFYGLCRSRNHSLSVFAMLKGDGEAQKDCLAFLQSGGFEDRLLLVHLMLSCIGERILAWKDLRDQEKEYQAVAEGLERFARISPSSSDAKTLDAFLQKERGILDVRREHGLSSEEELARRRQALCHLQDFGYRIRQSGSSLHAASSFGPDDSGAAAQELLEMLQNGIALLEEYQPSSEDGPSSPNAALTCFLSGLWQNQNARRFFQAYPENACAACRDRLDFPVRAQALKELLARL